MVELRRLIRSGIAASAVGHLAALAVVLIFAEVRPFGSVTAEPIAVDIVASDEVAENKPEPPSAPKAQPSDSFELSPTSAAASRSLPPAAPQQAAVRPQEQAALSAPRPKPQQAAVQTQPPATTPLRAVVAPEPDLSVKYQVALGLPQDLPQNLSQDLARRLAQNGRPDGFDTPASTKAEIASDLATEFRRHLKTCSTLPKSIAPSEAIRIKLRVLMAPDGRLAAEPVLMEASASAKGPALMQSAISALQACQPYAMLPADNYREWRVLDLDFTPQDFGGAS